jgi:hypothetical protein
MRWQHTDPGNLTGGHEMRHVLIVFWMLLWSATSVMAQVSIGIGIGLPGVNIGINLPFYPELVRVSGYPVYYAPGLSSNFFFYDGMYWIYQYDNWYASSWYNGPWSTVDPYDVPQFILRIPVRYYRSPPSYFYGWRNDAPPRWGDHWGNEWQQRRSGWDQWSRNAAPAPAPLPIYQRQFSGERYPHQDQQRQIQSQNYRYQPRDALVQPHYQGQSQGQTEQRVPASPRTQPPSRGGEDFQRPVTATPPMPAPASQPRVPPSQEQQQQRQMPPQEAAPREPPTPTSTPRLSQDNVPQGRGVVQEPRRVPRQQEKDRDKEDDRGGGGGRERNR